MTRSSTRQLLKNSCTLSMRRSPNHQLQTRRTPGITVITVRKNSITPLHEEIESKQGKDSKNPNLSTHWKTINTLGMVENR